MIVRLTSNRVVLVVSLLYAAATVFLPYRRELWNWDEGPSNLVSVFHEQALWVPMYFMLLIALTSIVPLSWPTRLWNALCHREMVIVAGYSLLAVCLQMAVGRVYIVLWTWLSLGLLAVMVMLVVIVLEKRVAAGEAVIIGIAIASLWRGLWEIPFQAGQKYFYDLPQLSSTVVWEMFRSELTIVAPLVLGGLMTLAFYCYRYRELASFNRWFLLLASLYVGTTIVWIFGDFWIEKVYNWSLYEWSMSPSNYPSLVLYKSSKVFMALALVSILLPRRKTHA